MIDATTQAQRHAHDHSAGRAREGAYVRGPVAPARASLLESSAAARLLKVFLLLAALWASVYWALH